MTIKINTDAIYDQLKKTFNEIQPKLDTERTEKLRIALEKTIPQWSQLVTTKMVDESRWKKGNIIANINALKGHPNKQEAIQEICKLAKRQLQYYYTIYLDPMNSPF